MYIALATNDEEGSKGSTRLHMDMADGVNIMVHSEARPDGSPGVAAGGGMGPVPCRRC